VDRKGLTPRVADIAASLSLSRSAVSNMVRRLAARGFVNYEKVPRLDADARGSRGGQAHQGAASHARGTVPAPRLEPRDSRAGKSRSSSTISRRRRCVSSPGWSAFGGRIPGSFQAFLRYGKGEVIGGRLTTR